jgi:hypothetical protein
MIIPGKAATLVPIDDQTEHIHMGTGRCTICDCPGFIANSSGELCANQNSAGGNCTHWKTEHQ